jgi:signal transduction histidine kinase
LLVEKDGFSKNTISLQNPVIYTKGISESEFGPIQYDEEIGRKDGDRWIEVRLLADGQCVGKIAIDNKKTRPSPPGHPEDPGGISEAHFPYLRMLAEGAAREILRERKLRKLEDQSKRLDTLRMLAEAVASPTPLHEDLKKIVETCAKLIGVQGVHLRLLEDNSLMLRAGQGPYYGIAQGTRKMLTPLEQSSGSVRAWLSGVGVIQDDAQDDQNLLNLIAETQVESQRATLKSIRSWACFPIHFEGNFLGVLGLQSGDLAFFGPTVQDAVKDFIAMIGPIVKIDSWPAELENAQKQLRLAARAAVHQVSNPNYANQLEAQTWLKQYSEGTATIKGAAGVLKSVSANSSRIAKLAERLRRFLKGPEIKRFPEAVRLAGVIARTVGSFLPASDGYRVVVSAESGAPDVHIDPAILADVFGELAANSRKAMKKGGDFTVTIRAATREEALAETLAENGLWARVEVSDSGPGIPPEKKRLVFEPFHSDFAEGSGLGLSLLRETLQGMGGAVREVGEPPCGAKFILLIPVHPREQKERK